MERRTSIIKDSLIFLAGVLVTHLYTRRRERKPEQLAPIQHAEHRHLTTMVTVLLRDRGISVLGEQPTVADLRQAVDQVITPTAISPGVAIGTPTMVRAGRGRASRWRARRSAAVAAAWLAGEQALAPEAPTDEPERR